MDTLKEAIASAARSSPSSAANIIPTGMMHTPLPTFVPVGTIQNLRHCCTYWRMPLRCFLIASRNSCNPPSFAKAAALARTSIIEAGAGPPFHSSQLPRVPRPCVCVLCRHRACPERSRRGGDFDSLSPPRLSSVLSSATQFPPLLQRLKHSGEKLQPLECPHGSSGL